MIGRLVLTGWFLQAGFTFSIDDLSANFSWAVCGVDDA